VAQSGWVKLAAVGAIAMGLGFAWPHLGNRAEAQFGSSIGRYTVSSGHFPILVDTSTGRSWLMLQARWEAMPFPDGSDTPTGSR
jgi:hypothetical protein